MALGRGGGGDQEIRKRGISCIRGKKKRNRENKNQREHKKRKKEGGQERASAKPVKRKPKKRVSRSGCGGLLPRLSRFHAGDLSG